MQVIDGKGLAASLRAETAREVSGLASPPLLAVLLVGDDAASHVYVALKEKAAAAAGIRTDIRRVAGDKPDAELLDIIRGWNADTTVNGILVQLPLPPGHDTDALIAAIDPAKDADGFHPENVRALLAGEGNIISPVHEGILRLIASTGMDVRQKRAALIANSEVFAVPLIHILRRAGFFVDRVDPEDMDPLVLAKDDVVIVAAGKPYLLTARQVKDGAVVIDVGTTRLPDGRVVGDADLPSFMQKDAWITPVPGGVGPMTVALLLKNVAGLAKKQRT